MPGIAVQRVHGLCYGITAAAFHITLFLDEITGPAFQDEGSGIGRPHHGKVGQKRLTIVFIDLMDFIQPYQLYHKDIQT